MNSYSHTLEVCEFFFVWCCVLLFGGRTKLFSRLFHFSPFFVRVIKKTVPINNPCPRNLIEFIRFLVLDGLTLIYECLASWQLENGGDMMWYW